MCPTIFLTREPAVSCIINNYTDIINNLDKHCKNGMASGKSTGILANMKSPLFILGIYMVFPIISILEKCNVMLQSKTITVSLMISSSKSIIRKLRKFREEIIFSDIIDRVNKCIDDDDIDELMLPRKIKRNYNNQHINIE